MINSDQFFDYLTDKIPDFQKISKRGQVLFTCPSVTQHKYIAKSPTMQPIPGSSRFYCLQCRLKVDQFEIVRLLEPDKKSFADEQILEYFINTRKVDAYPEFEEYKKYGWSLISIAKNGKIPLERGWTEKEHREKSEWLGWAEQGLNLGVRTGEVSGITVIDVDLKIAPTPELEEIYKELAATKTLKQNSPKGVHFIFKYDKDLKQTTKVAGTTIDIRGDGGQILVTPSKINNLNYNWVNLGSEIKVIPQILKDKLLKDKKMEIGEHQINIPTEEKVGELPKLKNNNLDGCCNDTFIRLGGTLIKNGLSHKDVEIALSIFNTQLLEHPMPQNAITAMVGSLEGYKMTEEQTQEQTIWDCCKLLQLDIDAKAIRDHTELKSNIINKYLAKLHSKGKLIRKRFGKYDCKEDVVWTDKVQEIGKEYKYKIPYFDTVAKFIDGNIILIGAPQGHGKTTISANFIHQMKQQGIKPYYVSTESGSSFEDDIKALGMTPGDYYTPTVDADHPPVNPVSIEIPSHSFTIIDWLDQAEDFAQTQTILKHFNEEMRRAGGILVVLVQIRTSSFEWFAPDLIKSYPAFATRFCWDDNEVGLISHFDVDKIRNPLGHYSTARVDTIYNFDTKELKKKS